jgi:hypothetical protein
VRARALYAALRTAEAVVDVGFAAHLLAWRSPTGRLIYRAATGTLAVERSLRTAWVRQLLADPRVPDDVRVQLALLLH